MLYNKVAKQAFSFTHFPFLKGEYPMLFVALMTFILIMSSVTMVLAVNEGHKNNKNNDTNNRRVE